MQIHELLSKLTEAPKDYEVLFEGVMVADEEQYLFVEKVEVDHEQKKVFLK